MIQHKLLWNEFYMNRIIIPKKFFSMNTYICVSDFCAKTTNDQTTNDIV
jgi:hypothetical protein